MLAEELWNQRYGHLNYHNLLLLQKRGMVVGLPLLKNQCMSSKGCALGKQHRE